MNIKKSDKTFAPQFFKQFRGEYKALALLLATTLGAAAHAGDGDFTFSNMTNVQGGSLTYAQSGNTHTLTQSGNKVVADWNNTGFDLNVNEVLNLINGANGQTLFRDVSNSASKIFGDINVQGSLFLSNKAGVIIGQDSVINVGQQFLATTGDIDATHFLNNTNGKFEFTDIAENIAIQNQGKIIAGQAAVLLADKVTNSGSIVAADQIAIGAFNAKTTGFIGIKTVGKVTIDMPTGGKITFSVTNRNVDEGGIANTGTIKNADYVANTVGDKTTAAVTSNADSAQIRLEGETIEQTGDAAAVTSTGALVVDAEKSVTADGTLSGANVTIEANGGLLSNAEVKVDTVTATTGDVTLDSDGALTTGAVSGANVDLTSGGGNLTTGDVTATGDVNVSAEGGLGSSANVNMGDVDATGTVTLDSDGSIAAGNVSGDTVDITAGNALNGTSSAAVNVQNVTATSGNVDLTASGDLTTGNLSGADVNLSSGNALNATSNAGGDLSTGNVTATGDVNVSAEGGLGTSANVDMGNVDATGGVTLGSDGSIAAGNVSGDTVDVAAGNSGNDSSNATANLGNVTSAGDANVTATGDLAAGTVTSDQGNVNLTAGQEDGVTGNITVEGVKATEGEANLNATTGQDGVTGNIANSAGNSVEVNADKVTTEGDAQIEDKNTGTTEIGGMTGATAVVYSKEQGNLTISGTINVTNNVEMTAKDGDIIAADGANITGTNVTLTAKDTNADGTGGTVDVNDVTASSGNIDIDADGSVATGALAANGGYVSVNAAKTVNITGAVKATTTPISTLALGSLGQGDVEIIQGEGNYVTAGDVTADNRLWIEATKGNVTLNHDVSAGNKATIKANTSVALNQNVTADGATITAGTNITGAGVLTAQIADLTAGATINLQDTQIANTLTAEAKTIKITDTKADTETTAKLSVIAGKTGSITYTDNGKALVTVTSDTDDTVTLKAAGLTATTSGTELVAKKVTLTSTGTGNQLNLTTVIAQDAVTLKSDGAIEGSGITANADNTIMGSDKVTITATGDVDLGAVKGEGVTITTATGSKGNISVWDVTATNNTNIGLTADGAVTANSSLTGATVSATARDGAVNVLGDITATTGTATLSATTGVTANNVTAGTNATLKTTTGDVTFKKVAANTTTGTVTLTATAGSVLSSSTADESVADVTAANAVITAGGTDAKIAETDDSALTTNVGTLTLSAKDGNALISEKDDVTLKASGVKGELNVTAGGQIDLGTAISAEKVDLTGVNIQANNYAITATTGDATLNAGTGGNVDVNDVTATTANVVMTAGGNVVAEDVKASNGNVTMTGAELAFETVSANATTGTATLTATVGDINGTKVTANAAKLTATDAVEKDTMTALDTSVNTLELDAASANIRETNGVSLTKADIDNNLTLVATAGNIAVDTDVVAGSEVTLNAEKAAITSAAANDVTGATVNLTAATSVTVGDVEATDTTADATTVKITANKGDVKFSSVTAGLNANVEITATGNVDGDGTVTDATKAEVTAKKATIVAGTVGGADKTNALKTDLVELDLTVDTDAYITDVGAAVATGRETFHLANLLQTEDGTVDISAVNKKFTAGDIDMQGSLTLKSDDDTLTVDNVIAKDVTLSAGKTLTTGNVTSREGDITMTSTGADIVTQTVDSADEATLTAETNVSFFRIVADTIASVTSNNGNIVANNTTKLADVEAPTVILSAANGAIAHDLTVDTDTLETLTAKAANVTLVGVEADTVANITQTNGDADDVIKVTKTEGELTLEKVTNAKNVTVDAKDGHLYVTDTVTGVNVTLVAGPAKGQNDIVMTDTSLVDLTGKLTATAGDDILLGGYVKAFEAVLNAGDTIGADEAGTMAKTAISQLTTLTAKNAALQNTGHMAVGKVTVEQTATLHTTGEMVALAGGKVTATTADLDAASIGTTTTKLSVDADTLKVNAYSGGAYVADTNADTTTLTGLTAMGDVDFAKTKGDLLATGVVSGDNVKVTVSNGDLTAMNTITGTGDVTLTATKGEMDVLSVNAGADKTATLTAGQNLSATLITADTAVLKAGAANTIEATTDVNKLTLTALDATITEANDVELTASGVKGDLDVVATTGAIKLAANINATDVELIGTAIDADGKTITAANDVDLAATTDDIKVANVTATNGAIEMDAAKGITYANAKAGTTATLNAQGGDISGTKLTATDATLTATGAVTTATSVDTLALNAGSATITEDDGITLNDAVTTGDLAVTAKKGDITLAKDVVGGTVTLDATAGAIAGGQDVTATAATANDVTLLAATTIDVGAVTGADVTIGDTGTAGDITLTGDVNATGAATITTKGDVDAQNITGEGVTVATTGNVAAGNVDAGAGVASVTGWKVTVGDVAGTAATATDDAVVLNAKGENLVAGNITATTGKADLDAELDLTAGDIAADGDVEVNGRYVDVDTVTGANATIDADGSVDFEQINVGTGNATITAGGDIHSSNTDVMTADIIAKTATLEAGGVVGSAEKTITTDVESLTLAGTDTYVENSGDLKLDASGVTGDLNQAVDGYLTLTADVNAANVDLIAQRITAETGVDITADQDVALETTLEGIAVNNVTATNGAIEMDAAKGITYANAKAGTTATLNAQGGDISGTKLTAKDATLTATGAVTTATSVDTLALNAGSATITEDNGLTVTEAVTTTGNLVMTAKTGDLVLDATVDSAANATLTATAGSITGDQDILADDKATLTAGTAIATGDITANGVEATAKNGALKVVDVKSAGADVTLKATTTIDTGLIDGQVVTLGGTTTTGKVTVAGDINASDTATITTKGDIDAQNIAATNLITLGGVNVTTLDLVAAAVKADATTGALKVADVTATTGDATLTAGTTIDAGAVKGAVVTIGDTGTAGKITLTGDVTATDAAKITTMAAVDAKNITGEGVTVKGDTIAAGDVDAGAKLATLTAVNGINVGDITGVGVTADAGAGNLVAENVDATTSTAILKADGAITAGSVDGTVVTIGDADTAGKITLTGNVTATTGAATVTTKDAIDAQDVTATAGRATLTAGTAIDAGNLTGMGVTATAKDGALTAGDVNAQTSTAILSATKGIDVDAISGSTTTATTTDGDVEFETINVTGAATLTATNGSITSSNADETKQDITATTANLTAATSVGAADDAITTAVNTINLKAGDSAYLADVDNVTVNVDGANPMTGALDLSAGETLTMGTGATAVTVDLEAKKIVATGKDFTATAGDVTATATDDSLTIGQVTAKKDANLSAGTTLTAGDVDAETGAVALTAGTTLKAGAVTAETGASATSAAGSVTLTSLETNTGAAAIVAKTNATVNGVLAGDTVTVFAEEGKVVVKDAVTADVGQVLITAGNGVDIDGATTAAELVAIATEKGNIDTTGVKGTSVGMTAKVGTITDTATVKSTEGDVVLDAGAAVNVATVDAAKTANIKAGTNVTSTSTITADDVEILAATGAATLGDKVTAEAGNATIVADTNVSATEVEAALDATLKATTGALTTTGAVTATAGSATLTAGTNVTTADVTAAKNATIQAGADILNTGAVEATEGLATLTAKSDIHTDGTVTGDDVVITAEMGYVDLDAKVTADKGNATIVAGTTLNMADVEATAGTATLTADGAITADAGSTVSGKLGASITSTANSVTVETVTSSDGVAKLTGATGVTANNAISGDTVEITAEAGAVTLNNTVTADKGDVTVNAVAGAVDANALITATKAATITAGTTVDTTGVTAGTDATLQAGSSIQSTGAIEATNGIATLTAKTNVTTDGTVTGDDVIITAEKGAVDLNEKVTADVGNATITAGTTLDATEIEAKQAASLKAIQSMLVTGAVTAGTNVDMTAGTTMGMADVTATKGTATLIAGGDVTAADDTTVSGTLGASITSLKGTVNAQTVTSANGLAKVDGATDVIIDDAVTGDAVELTAMNGKIEVNTVTSDVDGITLNAGTSILTKGEVNAKTDANLTAGTSIVTEGEVKAGTDIAAKGKTLWIKDAWTATKGWIKGIFAGDGATDPTINVDANMTAAQNLELTATTGNIDAATGTVLTSTTGDVILKAEAKDGNITTDTVEAKATTGNVEMTAGANVTAGTTTAGANVAMTAQNGDIKADTTTATRGDVEMTAGTNVTAGTTTAGTNVTMAAQEGAIVADTTTAKAGNIDMDAKTTIIATMTSAKAGQVAMTAEDESVATGTVEAEDLIEVDAGTAIKLTGTLTTDQQSTGKGAVVLTAGASIADEAAGAALITTGDLIADAGTNIGTDAQAIQTKVQTLAADATTGINVNETDKLTVKHAINDGTGNITVVTGDTMTVDGPVSDKEGNIALTAKTNDVILNGTDKATAGAASVVTEKGIIEISAQRNITAGTDVLVQATDKIALSATDGAITATDTTITSTEASVTAVAGTHVTATDSTITGAVNVDLAAGTTAATGSVTLTDTDVTAETGDATLMATTNVVVKEDSAVKADNNVNMFTTNGSISITDSTAEATKNDVNMDAGTSVTLKNAAVDAGNDVDVDAGTSVTATNSAVDAGNDVDIDATTSVAATNSTVDAGNDVLVDAGTAITMKDTDTTAGNHILEKAAGGSLSATGSTFDAEQNVKLDATANVAMNDSAVDAGNVANVMADGSVTMTNASEITATQDVLVQGETNVTMSEDSTITSEEANVEVQATNGNVTLGQVAAEAEGKTVLVEAGDNVVRAAGMTSDVANITATNVLIDAGNTIGQQGTDTERYVHVDADNFQALAEDGDLLINAVSAMTVTDVAATTVTELADDGTVATTRTDVDVIDNAGNAITEGAKAGNDLRLNVAETTTEVDGKPADTTLVVDAAIVTTNGDARIETESGSIEQNADISVGTDLVVEAEEDLRQNADIAAGTTGTGTADIAAGNDLVMADDTKTSAAGNVAATAGNDLYLELVESGENVLIDAGNNVIDIDQDKVTYDSKGQANNLASQETDVRAAGDLIVNAGNQIANGGTQDNPSDGLDVAVGGNVSAHAEGNLAITAPEGNLNLGEVESFTTTDVAFGTTNETTEVPTQNGVVTSGVANLAAKDAITDANGDAVNVTAEKIVFTAGDSVGLAPDGSVSEMEVVVGGGKDAVWGNSTTETNGSVIMAIKPANGTDHIDVGARPGSGVLFLFKGRYAGGDRNMKNFMTSIHGIALNNPLELKQFTVFDTTGFQYIDRDVSYVPGTAFIDFIRPMASLTWVTTEAKDDGTTEEVKEAPFIPAYNPDAFIQKTSMK